MKGGNFEKLRFCYILVMKKKPQIGYEDNLKKLLLFADLHTDIETEECRGLADQIKHHYYGKLMPNSITHLKVTTNQISVVFRFTCSPFTHSNNDCHFRIVLISDNS